MTLIKPLHLWTALKKRQSVVYILYYRILFYLLGVKYGKKCNIKGKLYIYGEGKVVIGDNFTFVTSGYLNPLCRNIKGAIYTASDSSIVRIGNNVGMSSTCLWAHKGITIGDNVNIGADCIIMDNDAHPHDYIKRRNDYMNRVGWDAYVDEIPFAPVVIDDDVWIGSRCQILKGVHIGARSIIAAGSVVTKDIPADCVAAGVPACPIKNRKV